MATHIPQPPRFDCNDWTIYEAQLNQFFLAYDVEEKKKAAILLTSLTPDAYKIVHNLFFPVGPEKKSFKDICAVLKGHFSPVVCVYVERTKFYEAKQSQ